MSKPTNEPTKEPPNMSTNESTNEPASPKQYSTRLTRDDHIRVQTLREAGFTYEQIAKQLNITQNKVQYACQSSQVTPKKARGAAPKLSESQMDEIIEWISSSKRNRRMPYPKVIKALNLNVTSGSHTRIYVTRKARKELDDTCVRSKISRRRGWMFWSSFHRNMKDPCLFWEKEWSSINAERYCERTVPLINGYLRLMRQEGLYLQLMQDGAPGHSSSFTKEELHS
ncbi:conserved hypothetical protein [Talaromyces stipitatus ATCC 10500]|uniref:Uncharacterized protein n=1 Tax=Talaromyces stipitatus (strain ATCC 10500 / CBS 375.48 / QM 6759 / NRRL 1006) TaxID=441959 RepID=B8MP15_TALSN|nr:uncharacterized protein TSTA_104680 [Talaromyces stipitatus ATCC 10500]EED14254.1 conserved hypothetical protein [Talaromyces stipitatus ATCC 10500]